MRTARRIDAIPPYLFAEIDRKIAERKAAGVDVISFGVGDPDLPTPDFVVEELARAAADPSTHQYPSYFGLPSFRRAVADFYRRRFGVELDPDTQVLPLIGSKEGIAHLPWAFVDPGDQVLVTEPGYPVYEVGTILAGGEPVHIPLTAEDGWFPDFAAVDPSTAPGAKLLWLCYPSNPTGAVATADQLAGGGPVRGRPRPAARLRQRLLRDHLRRLRRPVGPPGPGRHGRGPRVRVAVQDLQHDRLADRLGGRQPGGHRGPRPGQDQHRLGHLQRRAAGRGGRPGERHAAPARAAGDLPAPPRPDHGGVLGRRLEGRRPQGRPVRVAADPAGGVERRLHRPAAGRGRRGRRPRHRLRPERRGLHPPVHHHPRRAASKRAASGSARRWSAGRRTTAGGGGRGEAGRKWRDGSRATRYGGWDE